MSNQLLTPPEIEPENARSHPPPSSKVPGNEAQRDLLAGEPIWTRIAGEFRDVFFPAQLPPLELQSHAVAVRDPLAMERDRRSSLISIAAHVLALALILAFLFWRPKKKVTVAEVPPPQVFNITPFLPFDAKPQVSGGGGGGGSRDLLQAAQGRLPKIAKEQITPPEEIIRNPKPKLAVEPTVVMPTDIKLPNSSMPNLGDPLTAVKGPASNGTGSAGGIGSGKSGGIGSGSGGGVGPGSGGGYGGGVYRVGGGVLAPRLIYSPEAEFSDQARMAKYQGVVVVEAVVDPKGIPQDMRVVRALGMGLDEKALEAVKQYRFRPATLKGQPVAVRMNIEVDFHMY